MLDVRAGGQIGAFAITGDAHWIGVLTGPAAGLAVRPWWAPVELSADVLLDVGRVPITSSWGYPGAFWGIFPALAVGAAYDTEHHAGAFASLAVRAVRTASWSGASVEPTIGVRFYRP
jgi:hypothetical protein